LDLIIAILAVILSSIWNHATSSDAARWADRLIVVAAALLIGFYHVSAPGEATIWMISSLLFYGVAKLVGQTWPHVLAHGFQTISNLQLFNTLKR
jgi:hypothetical protein